MEQDPRQAIIQTLAFFDGFSMPLTKGELKRFLYTSNEPFVWEHVERILEEMVQENRVVFHQGHYQLMDRDLDFVEQRKKSRELADDLFKQSKNWLEVISSFPGVESVAICNNLGFLNATDNSDIDLFIITKPGQLWQTRFFLAALLQVCKKRPTEASNYGKFCLSFLVSADALSISHVLLEDDPYFEYWFTSLLPVYDPAGLLPKFLQENKEHWGHIGVIAPVAARPIEPNRSFISRVVHFILKPFHALLEKQTKRWQQKHFSANILAKLEEDQTDVVVTDTMLKFHTTDRRRHYRDLWREKMMKIN